MKIPKRFKMQDYRLTSTPMITNWRKINASEDANVDPTLYRQLIGSFMHLVNTRPNVCFAVNTLSQFMVEPKMVHWTTTRHVLRYLHETIEYGFRKQKFVALSSVEAEYMETSMATCEAIWLRKLLVGLFGQQMDSIHIFCDNQSCFRLSENPMFNDRSKHIDIRYHPTRDCV
eukprot:PITA_28465